MSDRPSRVRRPPITGLPDRLISERNEIRHTLGERWVQAVGAAVGRWLFEYLVLLVTLYGIGARPDIWLVLMAFVAAWYQVVRVVHGTDAGRTIVFMFLHLFFVMLGASLLAVIIGAYVL